MWNGCPWPTRKPLRHRREIRPITPGAAFLSRGEGAWFAEAATSISVLLMAGRIAVDNSIGYLVRRHGPNRLRKLRVKTLFANPDNITVSPWGDVFLAEDGAPPNGVRVLKPDGSLHHFARNALNCSRQKATTV